MLSSPLSTLNSFVCGRSRPSSGSDQGFLHPDDVAQSVISRTACRFQVDSRPSSVVNMEGWKRFPRFSEVAVRFLMGLLQ
jgi:hypothetical protein